MGLLDRFLGRLVGPTAGSSPQSLPRICYDIAYTALPLLAYNDCDRLIKMFKDTAPSVGPVFYVMACQIRKIKPVNEDAKLFQQQSGKLDDARDYFVLQYPTPPPVDLSDIDVGQLPPDQIPVLAPYFSAVLRHRQTKAVNYYTLGQASMGGGTTFRAVTASGENCNLGPGPEPRLEAFLAVLRRGR